MMVKRRHNYDASTAHPANVVHVPIFYGKRLDNISTFSMEEQSCFVFDTLDFIGYSIEMIKCRRTCWRERVNVYNKKLPALTTLYAGSKAEGITSLYESDIDMISLLKDAICTDHAEQLSQIPGMTVIQADTSEAPPGYTRLKLLNCNGAVTRAFLQESAFESELGDIFLSSSLLLSNYIQKGKQMIRGADVSGPAFQGFSKDMISMDSVVGITCYNAHLIQSWKIRPRLYGWPPEDVREDAASMLAQVVPVGSKGSCEQWREWRFCFIESELKLTYSLNETQLKLYIVLKMVAKNILRNVSKEISSYIMKNVTFWLCELLPGLMFRKENFLTLLFLSLRFLKSSIDKWNWLPYYMIPGRNLIEERLTHASRRQLSRLIETLLLEGPQCLLRCAKLRTAMISRLQIPALIIKYRETRDLVEMIEFVEHLLADEVDKRVIRFKLCDVVLPEWRELVIYRGIPSEIIAGVINERKRTLLS